MNRFYWQRRSGQVQPNKQINTFNISIRIGKEREKRERDEKAVDSYLLVVRRRKNESLAVTQEETETAGD